MFGAFLMGKIFFRTEEKCLLVRDLFSFIYILLKKNTLYVFITFYQFNAFFLN